MIADENSTAEENNTTNHEREESCSECSEDDSHEELIDILERKSFLRITDHSFPDTVGALDFYYPTDNSTNQQLCGKIYLIGTAHFSKESQEDVRETIQATQPDVIMLELCSDRLAILAMDEEKLLTEAKQLNARKVIQNIKESGIVQGLLHCMLLSISASITKQLGMAPGGEFRAAFQAHRDVPACKIHLGDRPINITLTRAFGSLNAWQKLKLFFSLLVSHASKITKEDVEKTKNRDLLEELLREMAGEFPEMSKIFVDERDRFMAHVLRTVALKSLWQRCHMLSDNTNVRQQAITDFKRFPIVVVAVVGIGHLPGITRYWSEWTRFTEVADLLTVPAPSAWPRIVKYSLRGSLLLFISYVMFRTGKMFYNRFI